MTALSPEVDEPQDHAVELGALISQLSVESENDQIVGEIGVLQSIYGDDAVRAWHAPEYEGSRRTTVRYEVHLDLPPPHDNPENRIRILVSLSSSYPATSPPQLQLLSRYIGAFSVDSNLFGSILRTFLSKDGVEWLSDSVCVFDGVENVRERCAVWYSDRLSEGKAHDLLRDDKKEQNVEASVLREPRVEKQNDILVDDLEPQTSLSDGITFAVAEPIVERKSVFIGRACRLTNPAQVSVILSYLISDRRIARAAHPIINAWRCKVNGVLHQDNDDDGETAAGGRLAHLLQILDVDNVLVVVTRYFGGILLGPDRFKHINQAARNALDLGGFLDLPDNQKKNSRLQRRS